MKKVFLKALAIGVSAFIVVAGIIGGFSVSAAVANTDGGTAEEGIANKSNTYLTAYSYGTLQNGDFSDGFKFWGYVPATASSTNLSATNAGTIAEDGTNKYYKRSASIDAGAGLMSPVYQYPDTTISAGDKLVAVYDYKDFSATADDTQVTLIQRFGFESGATANKPIANGAPKLLANPASAGGWYTGYTDSIATVLDTNPSLSNFGADTADYTYVQIKIEVLKKGVEASVDNIRLGILKDDNKIYALDKTTVLYDTATVITPAPAEDPPAEGGSEGGNEGGSSDPEPVVPDPEWAGTEDRGVVKANAGANSMNEDGPSLGLLNGDFEKGFKYWGTTLAGTNLGADAVGSIVTEANGNKYFQLKGGFEGTYAAGIKTCRIAIPKDKVDTSAKYVLIADVKADGDHWQMCLETRYMATGNKGQNAGNAQCKELATNGDWVTYSTPECTFTESSFAGKAENGVAAGDYIVYVRLNNCDDLNSKAAFDNLRIAKVSGSDYIDVFTGNKLVLTSASTGTAGTATGTTGGTGTGKASGTSNKTGESIAMLAALLFVSGASVIGATKVLKKSR